MEPVTLTAQSIFDTVYIHLLTQNEQSCLANGECAYRGEDGLTCAVGVLIKDDEYRREMDDPYSEDVPNPSTSVYSLNSRGLLPERLVPHINLLGALQDVHDMFDPHEWPKVLSGLAADYGLTVPVVTSA